MKHRIRHHDHPGRFAFAGTALAEAWWDDGGWQNCVGRWAVVVIHPGTSAPSGRWQILGGVGVERHTSLSKARRQVERHNRRMMFDQPVVAFLARWRRDLSGSWLDGESPGLARLIAQRYRPVV